jgi:hypothetical protein
MYMFSILFICLMNIFLFGSSLVSIATHIYLHSQKLVPTLPGSAGTAAMRLVRNNDCKCSWCGRRGASFCELRDEGVICWHSCFQITVRQQGFYLKDFRERQLRTILLRLRPGDYFVAEGVIENIAAWIGPKVQGQFTTTTTMMNEAQLAEAAHVWEITQDEVNHIKENCVCLYQWRNEKWYDVPRMETFTSNRTVPSSDRGNVTVRYVQRRLQLG